MITLRLVSIGMASCILIATACGCGNQGVDQGPLADPGGPDTDIADLDSGTLTDPGPEPVPDASDENPADTQDAAEPEEATDESPETCVPASCVDLGKECGIWDDGCGAKIACPKCPGLKTCSPDGSCIPDSGCPLDFDVTEFHLIGPGDDKTVYAGQTLVSYLSWMLSNPDTCPGCKRQVVLGVAGEPQGCADAGTPDTCPQATGGVGTVTLTAPSKPGTWNVRASAPQANNCDQAIGAWENETGVVLESIVVPGECTPETCPAGCTPLTCSDLDKECGMWGNGCGGPIDCGKCPGVATCGPSGSCIDPCSEGILEINQVSLNGGGDTASSVPGATVNVHLNLDIANPTACDGCARQLVLGFDDVPDFCNEFLNVPTCPDLVSPGIVGTVVSPNVAGPHTLFALAPASEGHCPDAEVLFGQAGTRIPIGTVYVHQGCTPGFCQALGKDCGSWDDGCGFMLDCGTCQAGDMCDADGLCFCSADDAWEPNDTPGKAHDLGTFGDSDETSKHHMEIGIENEADWFRIGLTDEMFAVVNPYLHVASGLGQPFQVYVAYVCGDGSTPGIEVHETSTCPFGPPVDLTGVPEVGATVPGFSCPSTGDPVLVHFEPDCLGVDDSGTVYFGVSSAGPCSAFTLDLHL